MQTAAIELEKGRKRRVARSSKLTDAAYHDILSRIETGEYSVGLRLPSEQDLCRKIDVSRTVVRKAISRLRDEGIIETIRGSGAFVLERPKGGPGPSPSVPGIVVESMADVLECQQMRMLIEGEMAVLAAERWRPEDMKRLESALNQMAREDEDALGTVDEDLAFHEAIVAASHNRVGIALYATMMPGIRIGMTMQRGLYKLLPKSRGPNGLKEHRALLDLIRERKAAEIRDAIHNHISYFHSDLRRYG
ncbi:FadR/GntR family transcriptional regulator [Marinovum sp. 2_MG-2023]|uniref:FadR/GntR family transcriptional regulator n=1 Tax=unclassified Marinovum TaxID=2647166 RepID=UPI0026E16B6D|nr:MULTISPECIES: FadR/GntR family transcriptional regulator [unclassified Marinovum]MDO6732385.1 FadR/GntR family transcriptional regulator [Marinovum sp. 2_MG-2023]MDO6781702.1 FadR/GntR family transcriptional regulator [Marinovum sp. 1_MG-2023]